jgi:hypothetical protein
MPTIGANSYGSVDEVRAFTRHLLDGSAGFDTSTRPTLTEVVGFIDRVSGVLNSAIASGGFTVPISQATAVLACDDWVVTRAAAYVDTACTRTPGSSLRTTRSGGRIWALARAVMPARASTLQQPRRTLTAQTRIIPL